MIDFDYNFLLVSIWALIGSVIGFYVIRYKPQWSTETCVKQLIISVSVGIFFAIPSYVIFVEKYALSERLSILLAGSTAFCITDLIITLWFNRFCPIQTKWFLRSIFFTNMYFYTF